MSDGFKVIESQEEFDRAIQDRLNRQKESYESKYGDYEEIKNENTSLKEQLAKANKAVEDNQGIIDNLNGQIEELNGSVKEYELTSLKTSIALKNGLPYALANRLVGDDEESIAKDAKNLSKLLTDNNTIVPPLGSTESNDSGSIDGAYKKLLSNLEMEGE